MTTTVLARKKSKNKKAEFSLVRSSENNKDIYQVKINNVTVWCFRAYEYAEDGINVIKVVPPYGIAEARYLDALQIIMSSLKVA